MTRIFVATPAYGNLVTTNYTFSIVNFIAAAKERGIDVRLGLVGGDALITRARANLVTHFLDDAAATHLLFIDADLAFRPEQAFRLLDFDVDVAAAVYPIKQVDWERVRAMVQAKREPLEAASLRYVLELADPQRIVLEDGFARVRYAGTGFLMIRREAIVKLCHAHPELRFVRDHNSGDEHAGSPHRYALFDTLIDPETGQYLSEDFAFCKRWTDLGGEIWADLTSKLSHIGPVAFNGDVATQFQFHELRG